MMGAKLRVAVLLAVPLAYGAIAFSVSGASDRAFDERMRRDRTELGVRLASHGATAQQVDDLVAYEADVSRDVAGYVSTTNLANTTVLMFLGVTLAGLVAFGRGREGAGGDGPAA
jgi:hypothetical protein